MVIWFTGMSGAGKSTLCAALAKKVKPYIPELVILDGDIIRELFSADLTFKETDRVVQITRIQKLAKMLSDQGQLVMVAALYANPDLLRWNRENFSDYAEIYMKASMSTLRQRDSKGLYGSNAPDVVGVDIPWQEPLEPDFTFQADNEKPADQWADELIAQIPRLSKSV